MIAPRTSLVLGLGDSGRSAAQLLAREGWRVLALDEGDNAALRATAEKLTAENIPAALGVRDLPAEKIDLAVISPGLPPEHRWVRALFARGVPVVPEFEVGWSRLRGRTLAVTGTNGKSTAVKWLAESLRCAGFTAEPCGNYGLPVCDVAMRAAQPDWAVIETSSFQLEMAREFRACVGVLLNLLPNHLDRHPDFEAYAAAKARLFAKTREGDAHVVPASEIAPTKRRAGEASQGRWVTFGAQGNYRFVAGTVLRLGRPFADLRGTYFDNEVLGVNASAVVAALDAAGVDPAHAATAARVFEPLPHRMQPVGFVRGVRYVNDSKATTLSAVAAALGMCKEPVRLIAGGILKETPADAFKEILARRAAGVYLIGRAAPQLFEAWSGAAPCIECGTLEAAVARASAEAEEGEVVLLSPGCASFDQFSGYTQRGDVFRSLVKAIE